MLRHPFLLLRWLEKEQCRQNNDLEATRIKQEIKCIKKQENSIDNKKRISDLYNRLYEKQFQQDYMMLVMDSPKDYRYACKHGFSITIDYGYRTETVEYKRFLGTAGSIKKSTIIFVNKKQSCKCMSILLTGYSLFTSMTGSCDCFVSDVNVHPVITKANVKISVIFFI